ncbi:MAG: hypothetical protein QM666_08835 [Acinetobacter sp.]
MTLSSTLFMLQGKFKQGPDLIQQLIQMAAIHDPVILMGEFVLYAHDTRLKPYTLYLLENDAIILDNIALSSENNIRVVNYSQLTDLILQYQRCISFK